MAAVKTDGDKEVQNRVLAVAQKYAEDQGWPWRSPIDVKLTRADPKDRQWTVKTNAFAVGMNVRVVVRETDLTIVESAYLRR
jgi:hypothetical protein